jgi:Tol biopolymer transport system component
LGSGSAVWVCAADGTRARQLVGGASPAERFFSPVWLSDTQLVYVRDPKIDRLPETELWQVDADKGSTVRVLSFGDLLPGRGAIVTDASPDGSTLLVAAQRGMFWATADLYLLDWRDRSIQPLWQDPAGDYKDARPLWSPTARVIAWHHNFTPGSLAKVIHYGVAVARQVDGERWNVEFQPDQQAFVTPLAWSPDGNQLLCARRETSGAKTQQLLLLDSEFRVTEELFSLDVPGWHPEDREFGNLADWAIIPADVPLPSDAGP